MPFNIRAQAVLQGTSNKPEDVFVNTFHFSGDGPVADQLPLIVAQLTAFYNTATTGTPSGSAIAATLSAFVSRAANASKFKLYDMDQPKPRIPTVFNWTLGASEAGTAVEMPAEVALCASFYAGVNQPRFRGRVYIGPFSIGYTTDDTVIVNRAIPSPALIGSVAGALKRLIDVASPAPQLAVYSERDQVARVATAGWVDNAWDTQRRRGQEATARTLVP